jgi:hypothetical protein
VLASILLRFSMAPALLCCRAGDAEPGRDLGPGVPGLSAVTPGAFLNSAAQCGVDVRRGRRVETRTGRRKAREQAGVRWVIVCCALAGL